MNKKHLTLIVLLLAAIVASPAIAENYFQLASLDREAANTYLKQGDIKKYISSRRSEMSDLSMATKHYKGAKLAQAYYELGTSKMETARHINGWVSSYFTSAEECFDKAVSVKPNYAQKIADFLCNYIASSANTLDLEFIHRTFAMAKKHAPNIQDTFLTKLRSNSAVRADLFSYIYTGDEDSLKSLLKACNNLFNKSSYQKVEFAHNSRPHQLTANALGNHYIALAKKFPANCTEHKMHLKTAKSYLGDEQIQTQLPEEAKTCGAGIYNFPLNAGETSTWITFPPNSNLDFSFRGSNRDYEVLLYDGTIVRIWKGEQLPQSPYSSLKFKFRSIKNSTTVKLTVSIS